MCSTASKKHVQRFIAKKNGARTWKMKNCYREISLRENVI